MNTSTVDVEITINPLKHQHRRGRRASEPRSLPPRIPRITRLMALAIKFEEMVRRGEVRDYADLARLGYVSRARITQIMNLLNLAPDIQERFLSLEKSPLSDIIVTETQLRYACSVIEWDAQRRWLQRSA